MTSIPLLIVDDNARMRAAIRAVLAGRPYVITEAADGLEGVETFSRLRPQWVVMDVSMPRLDGIEATRRIHALDPSANVIVVTDYGDEATRRATAAVGARAFLTKDDLFRLLEVLP
jgi:CheY-like chemotaxis protein